ncbi:hypothetical protein HA49_12915 [Tatumella morbirosei]|uniref:UPF0283 membrane protein HA49_12915 n=1 Tax=Tatumella morbirosei TaxID=642227 RepID=A0A095T9D7_9GAMM|nr:TIGR01620 family protein [Tatumella morbirosei]KGD73089.1 hypothetical protein HA49_12915 [Tatumella morbirosei]
MSEPAPIKPRVDFNDSTGKRSEELRPAQHFDNDDASFTLLAPLTDVPPEGVADEEPVVAALRPRRTLWQKILMAAVVIFLFSVAGQTVNWLISAWQTRQWAELGAATALGLVIVAGLGSLAVEWRRLFVLRHRAQERDEAQELLSSHGNGKARAFCENLAARAGIDASHPAYRRWQAELQDSHNDREVMVLYAARVQPVADKQARAKISRYAAESTLMIAVSPLAMVDMAFIAWRNIRMINQIARIYGIELGYFSRLRLFRGVLFNIAFAGASELVREVGLDWMSQDIMARLSARAAQGIGAGLLTARLGIKAMELCRPLPWLNDDKPRLADFRSELLIQLRESMRKKTTTASKADKPVDH